MLLYCTMHAKNGKDSTVILDLSKKNNQLLSKINQLLIERNLLQPDQAVLITVSGGQDSICLLNILYRLSLKWNWKLGIVHCDHKWSSTSFKQGRHVSSIAVNMQINYYQMVTTQDVNTEQLARIWRYEAFQRVAIFHNYKFIVTAHNASDKVETIIHNLTRGSGFSGLQPISWKRDFKQTLTLRKHTKQTCTFAYSKAVIFRWHLFQIRKQKRLSELCLIRPFLNITRIELQRIIQEWNLPVYLDPTNQNIQIRRNRIRHQLLPYLRKYFNPKIDYVLNNLAEIVYGDLSFLNAVTNCVYGKNEHFVKQSVNCTQLDLQLIRALPLAIQRRILKRFLDMCTGMSIQFHQIEQVRIAILISAHLLSTKDRRKKKQTANIVKCFSLPGKVNLYIYNERILLIKLNT